MTLLIQAANVEYAHGGNQIFTDMSFEVHEGDRLALIGENGAGKSTLFRLMARQLAPHKGAITHRNNLTVGYLAQEAVFPSDATLYDAVATSAGDPRVLEERLRELEVAMAEATDDDELAQVLDEYGAVMARLEHSAAHDFEARIGLVLRGLRFDEARWQQPVAQLSGGEKKLVALAGMLLEEPDVLLLDEPDNHLDVVAKGWLEQYIRNHRGAVALISHDRYFIDRVANRIFELEDGGVTGYAGNYSQFLEEKQARLERMESLYELQRRELKKLKESAEQLTQWARQNPKFAARAGNKRRLLEIERERLDNTPTPNLNRRRIDVDFNARRGSTLVLEAKGLAKSYGAREVLQPFDLELWHGERVGLVGPNGAGKTTLFRMILGLEEPSAGRLRLGPSIVPGYYAQEQETLDPNMTPLEHVRKLKPMTEQQAVSFLVGLLFTREDAMNRIGNLSGGERSRLQIASLILQGANFLLLDEPTNNLDIPSIEVLEAALLDFEGSILTISHDRYYLDKLCTRMIELDSGIVRDYPGGYSHYDGHRGRGTVLTIQASAGPAKRR
ncbi:MAG: ABC transporter ATP-binding protein [Chloroflexi bacterium]|nr:MAG: ABC transporter ATP-binding protein [Chloroflexota bacterium]